MRDIFLDSVNCSSDIVSCKIPSAIVKTKFIRCDRVFQSPIDRKIGLISSCVKVGKVCPNDEEGIQVDYDIGFSRNLY